MGEQWAVSIALGLSHVQDMFSVNSQIADRPRAKYAITYLQFIVRVA